MIFCIALEKEFEDKIMETMGTIGILLHQDSKNSDLLQSINKILRIFGYNKEIFYIYDEIGNEKEIKLESYILDKDFSEDYEIINCDKNGVSISIFKFDKSLAFELYINLPYIGNDIQENDYIYKKIIETVQSMDNLEYGFLDFDGNIEKSKEKLLEELSNNFHSYYITIFKDKIIKADYDFWGLPENE